MTAVDTRAAQPSRLAFLAEYAERVYAGVLGKLIGVYLGRPIEGWTYERISQEIGEVDHYVHEQPTARRWWSPTMISPAPSPSCARWRMRAIRPI